MTILIDIDDTIWDLLGNSILYVNKTYGLNLDFNMCYSWDSFIPKIIQHIGLEQYINIYRSKDFWKQIDIFDDAKYYINKFLENNYDIYFVSSTDPDTVSVKFEVLHEKFDLVTKDRCIFTFNKQMIKANYLIDDNIHNLIGGDYEPILIDSITNKHIDNNIVKRYNSWKEIYEYISNK